MFATTLRPHPAHSRTPSLVRYFTERDRVASPPDLPDQIESSILLRLRSVGEDWDADHNTESYRGCGVPLRLAAMRLIWWGWIGGQDWTACGPLTPEGDRVLHRYLLDQERRNNALAAMNRRQFYPSRMECDAREGRRLYGQQCRETINGMLQQRGETTTRIHELEKQLLALAIRLGDGVDNIGHIAGLIRDRTRELRDCQKEVDTIDDRVRLLRNSLKEQINS